MEDSADMGDRLVARSANKSSASAAGGSHDQRRHAADEQRRQRKHHHDAGRVASGRAVLRRGLLRIEQGFLAAGARVDDAGNGDDAENRGQKTEDGKHKRGRRGRSMSWCHENLIRYNIAYTMTPVTET